MMGKDISEQILLTKEMVHNLDRKAWGGNIIVKLDLSKAFDKLKWSFLFDVLLRFGFSNRFIHIIHNLMNSSKYSVVVNGKPCGFFSQTRGIKQGDPLSPLLFIIANEAFSKNLNKLMNHGVIGRYNCGNNSIPISHLSYADDIIIFCNSSCRSLVNLKFFLKTYQECSGQNINKQKSSFFVGKFQNSRKIAELDMQHKKLPFTYLGISIDKGIARTQHCNQLITAFDRKLGSWQFKQLDQAGRLILINHVLNTLPIFFLGSSTLHKSVQNILKQKMSRFWWKSKHHWVKWEDICTPKEEGGLGIRDLSSLQDSFSLKLWWNYHSNTSLWAKFMHAKYERDGEMEAHIIDSPVWKRIVEIDEIGVANTTENEEGILNWERTSDKLFSLSSAYDICRVSRPTCRSFMYIWGKGQNPKVSIFLWKLFKKALPIPENLERLGFHLPSVCFLCHNGPYTASHCLLECQQVINNIANYTRQWLLAKCPKAFRTRDDWLISNNISPPFRTMKLIRMVKWLASPSGRLKLNVDASYTPSHQRGACILRDDKGNFIHAASFSITAGTSYIAEVQALIRVVQWAVRLTANFIIETDAWEIYVRTTKLTAHPFSMFPTDVLSRLIQQHKLEIRHTLRQANRVADLLAKEDRIKDIVFIEYKYVSSLPINPASSPHVSAMKHPSPSSATPGGNAKKPATGCCIAGMFRRLLCSDSLSKRPPSSSHNHATQMPPPPEEGGKTGVVAKLMGLESMPLQPRTDVSSKSLTRSHSLDSHPLRRRTAPRAERPLRARSFREIPTYMELDDKDFFILSFEYVGGGGRRGKCPELAGFEQRKSEMSLNKNSNMRRESLYEAVKAARSRKAKKKEDFKQERLLLFKKKMKERKEKAKTEGDSEKSSPNSVLDFVELTALQQTPFSSGRYTKSRRTLSGALENHQKPKTEIDDFRPKMRFYETRKKNLCKDESYVKKVWEESCRLGDMDTAHSSWMVGEGKHEICGDLEMEIVDELVGELVDQLHVDHFSWV
ncbi:unnamed protein product [Cuscuta campestris]|uniref:Reverse transcriptase domain-containing protein n=1 Tax=Cuscuta campestris TaxID=132261 RepID=A0A484L6H7_9ASTE|nr:unnamed protein product [Cuscuta campestris]